MCVYTRMYICHSLIIIKIRKEKQMSTTMLQCCHHKIIEVARKNHKVWLCGGESIY
jgi:hypothetical protein